jgi:hypothetical protein
MMASKAIIVCLTAFLGTACGSGDDVDIEPLFPTNYESTYLEVRNCRQSGDHDLNNIRILADPTGVASYRDRLENFPVGAIVLKEEYEFDDRDCTGPVKQWTVMQRLPDDVNPSALDWDWQKVAGTGRVVEENTPLCYGCHTGCGFAPDGFDGTCTVP